jgi:hypothetical protein
MGWGKLGRDLHYHLGNLFFVCVVLGFALTSFTLSHSTSPFFVKGFFEIGFHELFARAGFEL